MAGFAAPESVRDSMSRTLFSLAGFQVIITGRFWVIAEVVRARISVGSGGQYREVGDPSLRLKCACAQDDAVV